MGEHFRGQRGCFALAYLWRAAASFVPPLASATTSRSATSPKGLRPVPRSIVDVTRMPGIAQPVTVLSVIRIFRCTPAVGNLTIAADRFDRDRHTMAGCNGIAGVIRRSLLLAASSHEYSGETRMADIEQPSIRLPAISPWLALMRMPRERTDSNTIPRELRRASRSE